MSRKPFFNLYSHGFARVAAAVPRLNLANPKANVAAHNELMSRAAGESARLVVFPELSLTGYSCEDLFRQQALLMATEESLVDLLEASTSLPLLGVVGLPVRVGPSLFNCAAVLHRGELLGLIPKTYLPNYGEFYELRQFASGAFPPASTIDFAGGRNVPFGTDLLFRFDDQRDFVLGIEICEDLWVPFPPSAYAALAGATVVANLSASNVTVGKPDYRRMLCASASGRCVAGYVYSAAGEGESTTDFAWDGHAMIYENGTRLAESERFAADEQLISADLDLDRLVQDRMRQTSFSQARELGGMSAESFRILRVEEPSPTDAFLPLRTPPPRFPYVPTDTSTRDERCRDVFHIQVHGLVQRLRATGIQRVVIGVSGGLDSTLALLICVQAMDRLKLPRENVLACTMPGFATTERTYKQARSLMTTLGCTELDIDIRPATEALLRGIDHPYAKGSPVYDITFENAQAGERTSHLFRLANMHAALVVGTSDLSELALGWCTYGIGDHMSHYHVNASVPKTLVRYIIQWAADREQFGEATSGALTQVLATTISPELVPYRSGDQPGQCSEAVIGPYSLQDFHLYYTLRFGDNPPKVAFMAWSAWHDASVGPWPPVPDGNRPVYGIADVRRWLGIFLDRFFRLSQFKRSAIPNAPKVGSGGSLSPRGDWRAPSDSPASTWLDSLREIPDREPD